MLPGVLLLGFASFPWVWGSPRCQCRCTCLPEPTEKALQVSPRRQSRHLRHSHPPRQRHRLRGSRSRSEEFLPQILDHPSDLVVRWDQPATLRCRAAGNPVPTIEWYRNGEYVKTNKDDATSQRTLLLDGSLFFLRLSQKKGKSDEGIYSCLARNHLGTAVSKNASLYVEALQEEFRLHPSDLTVTTGERFLLECMPPKGHPEPVISWKKNGVPINVESGHYEVAKGRLLVSHALRSDSGTYICMASNQAGERASREAVVSVWEKPTFSRRPNDVQAKPGSTVQFMCGIHGDPTPVAQWHKEDGDLPAGRYEVSQENILQIHELTINDAGKYICTAHNDAGMISAKATLTVEDPLDTGQREQDASKDAPKEATGARVYLINVTAVPSAPAAHLHWKLIPTSQIKNVESFVVFYRSLLPLITDWAEWNVPRDHRTIVAGLERGYTYEFKVRPYSEKGHGLDSNMRHLWIPEEVPSGAPQSISITTFQDGNGTVIIHWAPPPHETHNGIIKAYQVWVLGNETHHGFNKTVDAGTHSLEATGLINRLKYCVQVAAVNGAGIGMASNPVCSAAESSVGKMAKTSDTLASNYILEVVRQPVFIASMGSALWIMLMVLAVYVCQQEARQYSARRQYALGEGLYRNASDDTIIKHRVDSSDSPWLSNTWKSTSGSKNYSTSSSLSSQLLWTEPKDSQELHKSISFDRQSQGSHSQTVPLVPDSRNSSLYGALYVDLPAKDPKTFYGTSLPPPLSSSSLPTMGTTQAAGQSLTTLCAPNLGVNNTDVRGRAQKESWKTAALLPPNLIIQGPWDKYSKKELQQVHSTPMPLPSFSGDWNHQGIQGSSPSSRKQQRLHGETKKVVKKNHSSPRFLQHSASKSIAGLLLPPPPPIPPGFQAPQEHNILQECTCTCYLDPDMDRASQHQDEVSQKAASESREGSQTIPTLPYSHLSSASISLSLNEDRETVLTPEDVAEYLELSEEAEHHRQHNDGMPATPHTFASSDTYGYICSPLASELLENDDDDPNMEGGGGRATKFFRGFCRTPSSSLSEDEASLGGSLLNGWGSVSEDNGTSTRCSLISSSDGSFLMDASFAQALAVAVDSFCFGLTQREVDKALTDFLPSASPLNGLLHPYTSTGSSEEVQQKPGSQALSVWEWSTDWVDEMESKYSQEAENWNSLPKLVKGRMAALGEAQPLTTSAVQGGNGTCVSNVINYPATVPGATQPSPANIPDRGPETFPVVNGNKDQAME
nr:PREDICTED: roundabout homolog 4 isoform X2 [Anolis carolinensis]|eukprot:XP_008117297.1 PREDICTED: roundabout homolog 4 isoform X2 [Anolis carolinensis]